MLMQRVNTALILVALVVVAIFYLPLIVFSLLVSLVVAIAVWEFSGFFWGKNYKKKMSFLLLNGLIKDGFVDKAFLMRNLHILMQILLQVLHI